MQLAAQRGRNNPRNLRAAILTSCILEHCELIAEYKSPVFADFSYVLIHPLHANMCTVTLYIHTF